MMASLAAKPGRRSTATCRNRSLCCGFALFESSIVSKILDCKCTSEWLRSWYQDHRTHQILMLLQWQELFLAHFENVQNLRAVQLWYGDHWVRTLRRGSTGNQEVEREGLELEHVPWCALNNQPLEMESMRIFEYDLHMCVAYVYFLTIRLEGIWLYHLIISQLKFVSEVRYMFCRFNLDEFLA